MNINKVCLKRLYGLTWTVSVLVAGASALSAIWNLIGVPMQDSTSMDPESGWISLLVLIVFGWLARFTKDRALQLDREEME